jgi:GNAT superfamily N-acetyltransferase
VRRSAEDRVVAVVNGTEIELGPLRTEEHAALFDLFADVVFGLDGFPHAPPLTRDTFEATWIAPVAPVSTVVCARVADPAEPALVGAYYLKPNFVGRAAHIANAGYVVAAGHRRRGIGRLLVEDSLWRAPLHGFDAMQFNLVFESNPARALYESLGFRVVGTVPDAVDGEDALVYWRRLEAPA